MDAWVVIWLLVFDDLFNDSKRIAPIDPHPLVIWNKDLGLEEGSKLTSTTRAEKIDVISPPDGTRVGDAIAELPSVGKFLLISNLL